MNILQICHKPPYPPIDGGSIAMYNLYRGLVDNGHNVDIVSFNTNKQYCNIHKVPQDFLKASDYTLIDIDISVKVMPALFNLFTDSSYNIVRFSNKLFQQILTKRLESKKYDFIILESLYSTVQIDLIRKKVKCPIVIRSHNVEFKILENLYRNEKNLIKKCYLNLLYRRLKKYELLTLNKSSLIACISNEDILNFKNELCSAPMIYLPFGINFNDDEYKNYQPPVKDEMVLFHIGSMDWIPHQEALRWFLDKVWMKLINTHPEIKLHLAGSKMPQWVTRNEYPNVVIINGYANSQTFMNDKAFMIVPSFSGSGIRVKIAEGMAKGKVILTTKNGAMGINCTHNENIFISDDSDEWITIISQCFGNMELANKISLNARRFAQKEFNYADSSEILVQSVINLGNNNVLKSTRVEI